MKNTLLKISIQAAIEAGIAILDIYENGDFGVELKSDSSPLTLADTAAGEIIEKSLLETDIPILSEEGKHADYEERKSWNRLWIVDPLDGTKEFIKKTGEFTVNIALIEDGYPVLGVVFVPTQSLLYYGLNQEKAFKVKLSEDWRSRSIDDVGILNPVSLPFCEPELALKIVASVSHLSEETKQFAEKLKEIYGDTEFTSVGSSIKICKVAEGSADIYPRLGPTMEWDTAAGQAVAEGAGASFLNWKTKERFSYNRENLLNDWFVVSNGRIDDGELKSIIKNAK